ncbi:hypothetical protein NGRA_1103 [Nosema granulosis]|uniref:Uncharacterized protein n=1 Tax=Nosema granulosis TaxID=83296 RepID=A0A9P6H031_9MICR|nr:hypothetical protein NGRA_1103 [Nosema granulosis]
MRDIASHGEDESAVRLRNHYHGSHRHNHGGHHNNEGHHNDEGHHNHGGHHAEGKLQKGGGHRTEEGNNNIRGTYNDNNRMNPLGMNGAYSSNAAIIRRIVTRSYKTTS